MSIDCISRQAAIDSICRTVCDNPEICESPCDEIKVLEIMPPAQPEIIRCRDCKHRTSYWGNCKLLEEKYHQSVLVGCDEFCSMAERRTDD